MPFVHTVIQKKVATWPNLIIWAYRITLNISLYIHTAITILYVATLNITKNPFYEFYSKKITLATPEIPNGLQLTFL